MATFTAYAPINMLALTPITGVPTVATATRIVFELGPTKTVFLGNFIYHPGGSISGTVDTMRSLENGILVSKVTDFDKDIGAFMIAAAAGPDALVTFLMGDNDVVKGSSGDDVLLGLDGRDVIFGYGGNDQLYGGDARDNLYGGIGNDTLYGEKHSDDLFGEGGADLIYGGNGGDYVDGGTGRDKLYGNAGDDSLFGGGGNDKLFGGTGNDFLYGGTGNDVMTGGADADEFDFGAGGGTDRIRDFTDGVDALWLVSYGFADANAVIALASADGTDTLFDFGGGDTLRLQNFDIGDLDATDFVL